MPATANERGQVMRRLEGSGSVKPVKTTEVSEITPENTILIALAPEESKESLVLRLQSRARLDVVAGGR